MNSSSDFPPLSGDALPDLSDGFRLAGWTVDPRRNRASRNDHVETIEPKVMQVLLVLARHAGEPVTRDLLMKTVWPDVIVTDDTLTRCVSEARKIFDRPAENEPAGGEPSASIIETIPKVGYSLVAPIRPPGSERTRRIGTPEDVVVQPGRASGVVSVPTQKRLMRGIAAFVLLVVAGGAVYAGVRIAADNTPVNAPESASGDTAGDFPSLEIPRPATSLAGIESMPSWSRDGSRLAFVYTPESVENSTLLVAAPGDPQPLELFSAQRGSIRSPVWKPDDLTILFVHLSPDGCRVLSVPALGGPADEIAQCRGSFSTIDISPDGALLAMDDWPDRDAPVRIVLQDLESGSRSTIPNDRSDRHDYAPRFSPDGRFVLFSRSVGEGQSDLFRFDREAELVERLTHDKVGTAGHSWDADGEHVIYSAGGAGGFRMRLLNLDDGSTRDMGVEGMRPDVSGESVAYEVRRVDSDILVHRNGQVTKVCDSTRADRFPAINPAGNFLIFASDRAGSQALYRCDLASGTVSEIDSGQHDAVLAPRIGPGGRIAYTAVSEGNANVYVIDRAGNAPRKLTPFASNDLYPAFSPDGNRIYFSSDRSGAMEIWRMPVGGGDAEQVTRDGGMTGRLSPDGATLYFQKEGEAGLWRIALDEALPADASSPDLVDARVDLSSLFFWLPTEDGILIAGRSAAGVIELELLDPDTGARQFLRSITEGRLSYGFTATPDLSIVALAVIERVESDIMTAALTGSDIRLVSDQSGL